MPVYLLTSLASLSSHVIQLISKNCTLWISTMQRLT